MTRNPERGQFTMSEGGRVTHVPTGAWFSGDFASYGRYGSVLVNGDEYERSDVFNLAHEIIAETRVKSQK